MLCNTYFWLLPRLRGGKKKRGILVLEEPNVVYIENVSINVSMKFKPQIKISTAYSGTTFVPKPPKLEIHSVLSVWIKKIKQCKG
jgi:hypothetical protein